MTMLLFKSKSPVLNYFGARKVIEKRGRGAARKTKVKEKVYTQVVSNCSAAELVPIIKKLSPSDSAYSDE
jgi:transposase-like protein